MQPYPMTFTVHANAAAGISSRWITDANALPVHRITMSIPPEFDGPGGGFSPEDLYAMALANCFCATFKVIASHSKLEFDSLDVWVNLTVDKDEIGKPCMKHADFRIKLSGADIEKAKRVLEKTTHSCFILNSVKTSKAFNFEFSP
jgi:organic hydroperoxide reductase OsmC/OhrA